MAGLFTAVRKDHFSVVRSREWRFNDRGDRVAQLLHVQSVLPFPQSQTGIIRQETLIVNTHLMFLHNSNVFFVRLPQALHFCSTYLLFILIQILEFGSVSFLIFPYYNEMLWFLSFEASAYSFPYPLVLFKNPVLSF